MFQLNNNWWLKAQPKTKADTHTQTHTNTHTHTHIHTQECRIKNSNMKKQTNAGYHLSKKYIKTGIKYKGTG